MTARTPPPATELTGEQYAGRSCCWCSSPLSHGAVSAGISRGRSGAHNLDTEVWACPSCARATRTTDRQRAIR